MIENHHPFICIMNQKHQSSWIRELYYVSFSVVGDLLT